MTDDPTTVLRWKLAQYDNAAVSLGAATQAEAIACATTLTVRGAELATTVRAYLASLPATIDRQREQP